MGFVSGFMSALGFGGDDGCDHHHWGEKQWIDSYDATAEGFIVERPRVLVYQRYKERCEHAGCGATNMGKAVVASPKIDNLAQALEKHNPDVISEQFVERLKHQ